jgi:glycosyltransferase involved in cell wall biosynthesis
MDRIFVASPEISRQIKAAGIEVPTIVRPSGVREPFFSVQRQPDPVPTVLTVARLSPVKGLESLIAARDKLDRDIRWVVAAGGDGEYADRLRAEIARRPNMRLVHAYSAEELALLHARAHLFVLPSIPLARQEEGMPTALMEAIASRTPVIATATGGVARVLGDGAYGLTVPPGDEDALAIAILQAIANPGSAASRAVAATQAGVAEPWDVVAQQIHGEYLRMLDAR